MQRCPICNTPTEAEQLDISFFAPELQTRIAQEHPGWQVRDGACPTCTRRVWEELLRELGDAELYHRFDTRSAQSSEIAFGALPLPIRLSIDPRFAGRGVTLALVDSGFYPLADLTRQEPHPCMGGCGGRGG